MLTDIYIILLTVSGVLFVVGFLSVPVCLTIFDKLCNKDHDAGYGRPGRTR